MLGKTQHHYLWLQLSGQKNDDYLLTALQENGYYAEFHRRLPKKKPRSQEKVIVLSVEESFRLLESGVLHALANAYRLCAIIPPHSPGLMERTMESEVMILFSINQSFRQMIQHFSVARLYKTYVDPLLQNDLLQAVRRSNSGKEDHDPSAIADHDDGVLYLDNAKASEKLTASERRVLDALLKGKSNRKIAEDDYLSVSTVNNHVSQITKKMDANDRTHTVKRVIELGWLYDG
ncbi:response regulator transcription factor [Salicibibacter cibarius]|uniref:Response regulator transcription factor n=1 Tax=Salicibibacter cibarius TaxID=2743000 RepID=A0A7T6Z6Q9_9BACI|nr:LuxR C-terminal-related transcriptional regulator [Salicibibacter cibarius]QQK77904.1 response regulator transcription factor [Salicibibacter cibarius]